MLREMGMNVTQAESAAWSPLNPQILNSLDFGYRSPRLLGMPPSSTPCQLCDRGEVTQSLRSMYFFIGKKELS